MTLLYVTVVGNLGPAAAGAKGYWVPTGWLTAASDMRVIPPAPLPPFTIGADGSFTSGPLLAQDSPGVQPQGEAWQLSINGIDEVAPFTQTYQILHANGDTQDLADLGVVVPDQQFTTYLLSANNLSDVPDPAAGLANLGGASSASLAGEVTRAVAAEAALATAISAETTRAEGAESALGTAIAAETTRAEGAEATLAGGIAANAAAITAETTRAETAEALLAPKASPAFTGTPAAPTAPPGTDSTQLATTAYADAAVAVETSRAETAEALKAPLASPALTGSPTAPTQTTGDTSTKIATDAFAGAAAAAAQAAAIAASLPALTVVAASASATLALNKLTQVTAASNLTMTLPSPVAGALIVVEREAASAGTVAVTGNIRGVASTTITLLLPSESEMFLGTASTWDPVAGHKTLGSLDLRYAPVVLQASGDTSGATDAAAITAAITAAAAGPGVAQLGPGTFWLNAGQAVPAGVLVAGMGTALTTVKVAAGASAVIPFLLQNVSGAGIQDLAVDLNKANTTNLGNSAGQMGVYLDASTTSMTGIALRRVTVQNGWQNGVSAVVFPPGAAISGILEDITVTACGGEGIFAHGCQNLRIVRPSCTGCGACGILAQQSSAIQVDAAACNANANHGLCFDSASSDFKISGGEFSGSTGGYGIAVSVACVNFTITAPTCESNNLGGISVDVRNLTTVLAGTATSGTLTTLTDSTQAWTVNQWAGYTVRITAGTGNGESAVIISNTATTLTFAALGTAPDATSAYAIDGSHIFYGVGATITGAISALNTGQGIWADYCSGLTVTGCEIHHNGGIGVDLNAQNCLITGNDIHDNTGRGVLINQGSDPMGGHRVTGNAYRGNQAGVNVQAAATSLPNIIDEYVNLGETVTLITATNSAWPIPNGANWLEITAAAGGGQGAGAGSASAAQLQAGAGAGACGTVSTQVVPVGANTTLNVTIGAGGSAAGQGGAAGGNPGTGGSNGTGTTVTGTGISVAASRGEGGGASTASSTVPGPGGVYATNIQAVTPSASSGGEGGVNGGAASASAAGGGGGGQPATATTGGAGGGAGTPTAPGTAGGGSPASGVAGGNGADAAANTGAGGGGGGGGAAGTGAGGNGGKGGSGYAIIRVIG